MYYGRFRKPRKYFKKSAKYSKKTKTAVRTYNKMKKDGDFNLAVGKYVGPFPTSVRTHLRYCAYKRLDPLGGVTAVYFRANGIYDPDVAVGGHQPIGRDQWAEQYFHYTVLGSKITVRFEGAQDGAGVYMPHVCGVFTTGASSLSASTWVTLAEQGHDKYIVVQGSPISNSPRSVVSKFSARKFFNVKDPEDVDSLTALVGADPTDSAYFCVWCGTADETTDTVGVRAMITIDYIVQWAEPQEVLTS